LGLEGSRLSREGSRLSPEGSKLSPEGSRRGPEGSGLGAYTVGKYFQCGNPNDLIKADTTSPSYYVYSAIASTNHYNVNGDGSSTFDRANSIYGKCGTKSLANTRLGSSVYRYCKNSDYVTDRNLNALYDAVHYVEAEVTSLRRPLSIAEVAVRSAGVVEQPILEGFGIMYYCGFYACVANNQGDKSKCYPAFDGEKDWDLVAGVSYADLKAKSDLVNDCITNEYLSDEEIADDDKVNTYNDLLNRRSYLCMAENEIVDFLELIYPKWYSENDAIKYVYGRHLADERCWANQDFTDVISSSQTAFSGCPSNADVYQSLIEALTSLTATCKANQKKTPAPEPYYGGYGQPAYGQPAYGQPAYGQPAYGQYSTYGRP